MGRVPERVKQPLELFETSVSHICVLTHILAAADMRSDTNTGPTDGR